MTWVKLSDTFAEQFEELGADALALHVAALCYCNRLLTDGRVPRRKAVLLFPIEGDVSLVVKALLEAGAWIETDAGYEIAGYGDGQPSSLEVRERQDAKRQYDREFQRDLRKAKPAGMNVWDWRKAQAKAADISVNQWLEDQRSESVVESRTTVVYDESTNRNDVVSPRPDPSRPVPTPREGKGKGKGEGEEAPPGPGGPSADAPGRHPASPLLEADVSSRPSTSAQDPFFGRRQTSPPSTSPSRRTAK